MNKIHWSGPALWYTAIVFSLIAIIPGAQQTMLMPDFSPSLSNVSAIRKKLASGQDIETDRDRVIPRRPSRLVLFALQAPLMCLAYSILLFLAGLTSVVLSPLSHNPGWNAEAKVCRLVTICSFMEGIC